MKILYFAPRSIHTLRFIERFREVFDIIYVSYGGDRDIPDVRNVHLPVTSRYARWIPLLNIPHLRRLMERERPDLVHAMYILPWGYYASKAVPAGTPLVLSAWGTDVYLRWQESTLASILFMSGLPGRWHHAAASRADMCIVECEHVRNAMGALHYDTERIRVIPWGPDCSVFMPARRDMTLHDTLSRGKGVLVGCTRYLRRVSGVDRLIRSLPEVEGDVHTVLIGSGPRRPALERLADRLAVRDRVTFLGEVEHSHLPAYAASLDIMVSPSLSDTVSVSLLEGMASGTAVIASDVGGTSEWVEHMRTGILLEENTPERIAHWISVLARDPSLRRRLGVNARRAVTERGDWRRTSTDIERLYRQMF